MILRGTAGAFFRYSLLEKPRMHKRNAALIP